MFIGELCNFFTKCSLKIMARLVLCRQHVHYTKIGCWKILTAWTPTVDHQFVFVIEMPFYSGTTSFFVSLHTSIAQWNNLFKILVLRPINLKLFCENSMPLTLHRVLLVFWHWHLYTFRQSLLLRCDGRNLPIQMDLNCF